MFVHRVYLRLQRDDPGRVRRLRTLPVSSGCGGAGMWQMPKRTPLLPRVPAWEWITMLMNWLTRRFRKPAVLYRWTECWLFHSNSLTLQIFCDNEANNEDYPFFSLPPECLCDGAGAADSMCTPSGQCVCFPNYGGHECDECSPGYYGYPDCAGERVSAGCMWSDGKKITPLVSLASSHDSVEWTSSFSHSVPSNPFCLTGNRNRGYIRTSSF